MFISQNNNTGIRSFRTLAVLQDDIILTIIYYIDNTYTTKILHHLFILKRKTKNGLKQSTGSKYSEKQDI